MRTLTATLTAAQKAASRVPYVVLQAHNKIAGVERFAFTRLYTGAEPESSHGAAIAGDGSLIRARISAGTIWHQRVATPGPGSDYTVWTDTGFAATKPIAVTAWTDQVSIFYVDEAAAEIRQVRSADSGATWFDMLVIALGGAGPPLVAGGRIAAAYSPLGIPVVFYILGTNNTVYWTYYGGGVWSAWQNANITGATVITEIAACARAGEDLWPLALAGTNPATDRHLQLACFQYSSQSLSDAENITLAPTSSLYTPTRPFLLEIDGTVHIYFVSSFTGVTAADRVYHSWAVPGSDWTNTPTTEPEPFNHTCGQGQALATGYVWLCQPSGVWRSVRTVALTDLSSDVIRIKGEEDGDGGGAAIELRNDDGRYASPGSGSLAALTVGAELRLGLGYYSAAGGNEYSWANHYQVDALAHVSAGGKAVLLIKASLSRRRLEIWSARYALRWNAGGGNKTVIDIVRQLIARAGIELNLVSFSTTADTFQPDFTVYPGQHGGSALGILLKMVPDVLRSNLGKFDQVNPQAGDSSVYAYGTDHAILEAQYAAMAPPLTRVRAEGRSGGAPVVEDSFDWTGQGLVGDRLAYVFDLNIDTAAEATGRGSAILRDAAIAGREGHIVVPAHAGQQLYDVVAITDARAGLSAALRRIVAIRLDYDVRKAVFNHTFALGAA